MTPELPLKDTSTKVRLMAILGAVLNAVYWPILFVLAFILVGASLEPEQLAQVESVLASPLFSILALLGAGVFVLGIIIQGTLATSLDDEMLGTKWSSLWVPIQTALWAVLMIPTVEGPHGAISPLASMALSILTWFH